MRIPKVGSPSSIGHVGSQESNPSLRDSPPPTIQQVPAPLRQIPVAAQQPLTPPRGFMFIPLDGPLPWKEAFACIRFAIEHGHPLNVVNFSELISACTTAGRVDEALEAFAMMKDLKIAPNDCTFDILISACESHGLFEKSDELLDDAVQRGVYQKSLGYDSKANELDLHRNKIVTGEPGEGGVSTSFARALCRYHSDRQPRFGPGTLFIVGRRGEGLLWRAVVEYIKTRQGTPQPQQREDGYVNKGAIYWTTPHQQPAQPDFAPASIAPAKAGLNPEAREFVPPSALSNPQVSWNLDAPEFVPSRHSYPDPQVFVPQQRTGLDPNAKEFFPRKKPQ